MAFVVCVATGFSLQAEAAAAAGVPPAIAVRDEDGGFRLVALEGPPPEPHDGWLELIAAFVRVDTVPAAGGGVRVTALERLQASPWPAPAASNPEDLRWQDLTGVEQSLAALRGRIVVVNRDGHVVDRVRGVVEEEALRGVLDRVFGLADSIAF